MNPLDVGWVQNGKFFLGDHYDTGMKRVGPEGEW
jgi:hypothetical protein